MRTTTDKLPFERFGEAFIGLYGPVRWPEALDQESITEYEVSRHLPTGEVRAVLLSVRYVDLTRVFVGWGLTACEAVGTAVSAMAAEKLRRRVP